MGLLSKLRNTLGGGDRVADDVQAEMQFHLEQTTADLMASGMTPADARREARRRFGAVTRLQDEARDADMIAWLEGWLRDLRLAARSLRRRPGMTLTAVASLAIGLGATAAIFTIVDAVLLKPLPLPEPERLMVIREFRNGQQSGGNPQRLKDWATMIPAFQATTGFYEETLIRRGARGPEKVNVLRTFGQFLGVLGVPPAEGRPFTTAEEMQGAPVAVLSHRFWSTRLNADPAILGKTLALNSATLTVIGVLPPSVQYPEELEVITPATPEMQQTHRRAGFLAGLSRLKPGVTLAEAQGQVDTVAAALATQYPDTDKNRSARLVPFIEDQVEDARPALLLLLATVVSILLIACVNVSGLLLARGAERSRESSIRVSLGAGRGSLIRLQLAESLMLALMGGILGITLALVGVDALKALLPAGTLHRLETAAVDARVLGFMAAMVVLSALVAGLAPALKLSRVQLSAGRVTKTRSSRHLRTALVVGQVMLSTVLVVGSALLARSLFEIKSAPLGFNPQRLTIVEIDFPWDTEKVRLEQFTQQALDAFRAIPGVSAASVTDRLPTQGGSQSGPILVMGRTLSPELAERSVSMRGASPEYLATIGATLKAGQWLTPRGPNGPREAIVNETLARLYFPDGRVLGSEIAFQRGGKAVPYRIVGIMADLRQSLTNREPAPEAFLPMNDVYWPMLRFALRSESTSLARPVREAVAQFSPDTIIDKISTMDAELEKAASSPSVITYLLASFAGVALLLAAIGLFGIIAGEVAERTKEIGIRLALGAAPGRVQMEVLRRGLIVASVGLAAGLLATLGTSRLLESMLYGVTSRDGLSLVATVGVLLVVAAFASWIPARRASRVDPTVALRSE
jgi:predicted permease